MAISTGTFTRPLRAWLFASAAALALSGCASIGTSVPSEAPQVARQAHDPQLAQLAARYRANPRDTRNLVAYTSALRAAGYTGQAAAMLEEALEHSGSAPGIRIAYAKALTAEGRFTQALVVLDGERRSGPEGWEALGLRAAIYDQTGRNTEARQLYQQAIKLAPEQASLVANLGLSYALTGDLGSAETHLRQAVSMPGANGTIRQNLALVLGLQGRFDEARRVFAAVLPAEEVEANMASLRAMLAQTNRWDAVQAAQ